MNKFFVQALILIFAMAACSNKESLPVEPVAEKRPVELELHDNIRIDNYFWLRDRENPEVIAYLEAENAYTARTLRPFKGLKNILFEEMKSRMQPDEESAPYRRGDYFYYIRYEEGSEYPIYARKKGSLDATEQVMLDVNKLAGDADYFAVSGFSQSG